MEELKTVYFSDNDEKFNHLNDKARVFCQKFNKTSYSKKKTRSLLLKKYLGGFGKNSAILQPFLVTLEKIFLSAAIVL